MANRFPLIVDSSGTAAIKELASGDNLDLTGNGIVGAGTVALTNITVGGSQGTDGQVLTSTGSGVQWEDAAAGGILMLFRYIPAARWQFTHGHISLQQAMVTLT